MKIGGLQKLTLIDYPDKLACTVFLVGCNYRCPFCYNPELVLPEVSKEHELIKEEEFFDFLDEREEMLEGVCITGGEPTLNQDLPKFCKKIKKFGYLVKLDTNGSNPKMLKDLIDKNLVDYVAMDVKATKRKYPKVIGLKECSTYYLLNNIEKSINILKEDRVDCEFRTTVIPTLLKEGDILKIAHWIGPAKKYFLQNFRAGKTIDPKFKDIKPYPQDYLIEIQKKISPLFEISGTRS